MSQETICGSHENGLRQVVLVEAGNMLTLIERGLEAPMAERVAKQYMAKCAEVAELRAVLLDMRLAEIGGTLRIGVIADDGAASAEIGGLHQETFRAWWAKRNAALARAHLKKDEAPGLPSLSSVSLLMKAGR